MSQNINYFYNFIFYLMRSERRSRLPPLINHWFFVKKTVVEIHFKAGEWRGASKKCRCLEAADT